MTKKEKPLNETSVIKAHGEIVSRTIQGEAVILNLQSGVYFGLNDTGTKAWELITKGVKFEALVKMFQELYDISAARAEKDLRALITQLRKKDLIQLA